MRFATVLFVPSFVAATSVGAQTAHPARVEVVVRDTAGHVVGGVEASVVEGVNAARATGTTDDRGRVSLNILNVESASADFQLVVRKIGYGRSERFFRATHDTVAIEMVLRHVPQELAPVVITEAEDIKHKSYFIDADAIANTDRVLIDATDILAKLRPDMICGRSCRPLAAAAAKVRTPFRACPGLVLQQKMTCPVDDTPLSPSTNVWVNGRRIRMVIPNEMAMARQTGMLMGLQPGTMTVLSEIKPEHILQMTYVDELDASIGKIGSEGGLFIVLKEGVVYEPGKESYVSEAAIKAADAANTKSAMPAYRFRILGVFDQTSGDPIEGAYVTDLLSGTKARTTATGTVSLAFLPEGATPVRISKEGFDDLTLPVEISATMLTPLTLTMVKKP